MSSSLYLLRSSLKLRSLLLWCRFGFCIYTLCQGFASQLSSQSADISPHANIVCLLLEEILKLPEQDTKRGEVLAILADGLEGEYSHLAHSAGSAWCSTAVLLRKKCPARVFLSVIHT